MVQQEFMSGINDKSPPSLRNKMFFKDKMIGYSIEYLSQLENIKW
ncbi:hypothetical protein [Chryseobacterium indoltheticum]